MRKNDPTLAFGSGLLMVFHFLELALKNGAQAVLQKRTLSADRLEASILKAIAAVKQDRERHNLQMRLNA